MRKKLGIFLLSIFFLALSFLYEHYSTDRQLHYIHHLQRGKLFLNKNVAKSIGEITKSIQISLGFTMKIQFSDEDSECIQSLIISKQYANIISTVNNNFIALLKSSGEIKSNGDSFYKIKDQAQKTCKNQYIENVIVNQKGITFKGYFLDCSESFYSFLIQLKSLNDIKIHAISQTQNYNRLLIYFPHDSKNNYFGLGEQFSNLNLGNNRPYSIFVREKGVARTDQPQTFVLNLLFGKAGSYYNSYSPAPIWISSQFFSSQTPTHIAYVSEQWAYSVWMNNHILVWSKSVIINIYPNKSIKQVLKKISIQNGYTPVIPDWVNQGAIVGLQGGTEAVKQKYQKLARKGAKIGGLWLQDWVSKRKSLGFSRLWWNWELDDNHYKGWSLMKDQLKQKNVNLLIYINPMLTQVENKKKNYRTNFFKQAQGKNHFIKQKQQKIFQTSAFSDWKASLLNITEFPSQSNQYFKNIFKLAIKQTGAKGLMVDFGEAYPVQNIHNSLEQASQYHNKYPVSYLKLVYQTLQQINDPQIYTFTRAGYLHSPKYAMSLWAGDQSMNFKPNSGLPSCLTAILSSGLVGYSNTHCDIGGYSSYKLPLINTSVRTRILMTRWMQLACFSPVFRTHEGNLPEQSLQVYSDEQIIEQFAFYSNIYSLLSSYRKAESKKSEEQKIPLIRPLFVENQNILEVYKIKDQFYLGSDILVSPILGQQGNRKNFVPNGKWVNIWNKSIIQGCNCYLESNSFLPSVLIKAESPFKDSIIGQVQKLQQRFKKIKYLVKNQQKNQL